MLLLDKHKLNKLFTNRVAEVNKWNKYKQAVYISEIAIDKNCTQRSQLMLQQLRDVAGGVL